MLRNVCIVLVAGQKTWTFLGCIMTGKIIRYYYSCTVQLYYSIFSLSTNIFCYEKCCYAQVKYKQL